MRQTNKQGIKVEQSKTRKEQRGITLVALVITIIIIIILATVTINMTFGDNGLIKQAELARNMAANSMTFEEESMANLTAYLNQVMNEDSEIPPPDIEEPFKPGPTPEPPTGGTTMEDMTNGIIEIKWLSGTSNSVSSTPNAPVIKTEGLPSGTTMEQVVFDGEKWVTGTEYSYVAGTGSNDNNASHWANARVTIEGIDSYFVWIPRYAYRIIYFDSAESKKAYQEGTLTEEVGKASGQIIGYSDSRGIVDAQGRKIDSVTSESNSTKTMVSEDYFMAHPAFTDEKENGGWDSELAGIWVGKYETSSVEGNSDSIADDNVTTKTAQVKPGVSSWCYIEIKNIFAVAKAYATNLESHLLKNSEWGAVAYLTESKYGRNGTGITISDKFQTFYTGGGAGNAYITNTPQSSTGNVYGIYDLSGNAFEYVAAGYLNQSDIETTNGSTKYATVYNGETESRGYKYGDATYETRKWHSDNAFFVLSTLNFFSRGGYYYGASGAGVFNFDRDFGDADGNNSFRLALVV